LHLADLRADSERLRCFPAFSVELHFIWCLIRHQRFRALGIEQNRLVCLIDARHGPLLHHKSAAFSVLIRLENLRLALRQVIVIDRLAHAVMATFLGL